MRTRERVGLVNPGIFRRHAADLEVWLRDGQGFMGTAGCLLLGEHDRYQDGWQDVCRRELALLQTLAPLTERIEAFRGHRAPARSPGLVAAHREAQDEKRKAAAERGRRCAVMHAEGLTFAAIGRVEGVSASRARQLVQEHERRERLAAA